MTKVGIYLLLSVFTHGQLYVDMSKVKSYNELQFALTPPSESSMTITSYTDIVVFKSAFYNGVQLFSANMTPMPPWVLN